MGQIGFSSILGGSEQRMLGPVNFFFFFFLDLAIFSVSVSVCVVSNLGFQNLETLKTLKS